MSLGGRLCKLREINFGEAEGLSRDEVRAKYADVFQMIDSSDVRLVFAVVWRNAALSELRYP